MRTIFSTPPGIADQKCRLCISRENKINWEPIMDLVGHFHLADAIIKEDKYFDISLQEVLRQHSFRRKFEVAAIHDTFDKDRSELVEVYLVLKVSGNIQYSISWDIALLMHNIRIDGFGNEVSWTSVDGENGRGWHRHVWIPRLDHAEGKRAAPCLDSVRTYQHFVTTALAEMRIKLSGRDDGYESMFHY